MPSRDVRFEELIIVIERTLQANRRASIDDRHLALLVIRAILAVGFVPIKSISDLGTGPRDEKEAT